MKISFLGFLLALLELGMSRVVGPRSEVALVVVVKMEPLFG